MERRTNQAFLIFNIFSRFFSNICTNEEKITEK